MKRENLLQTLFIIFTVFGFYFCGNDSSEDCKPLCGPGTHQEGCICVPDGSDGDGDVDGDSDGDSDSDSDDEMDIDEIDGTPTTIDTSTDTQISDASTAMVTGTIHRNRYMYLRDGAGQGDLYAGVYDKCPLGFEGPFTESYFVLVGENVDVTDSAIEFPYTIENIPPGHWYVMGFLDDDQDADPSQPLPDSGDMIPQSPPGCIEIDLLPGETEQVNIVLENYYP